MYICFRFSNAKRESNMFQHNKDSIVKPKEKYAGTIPVESMSETDKLMQKEASTRAQERYGKSGAVKAVVKDVTHWTTDDLTVCEAYI